MMSPGLQARTSTYVVQPRIPSSVFEGLFVRGLEPHASLTGMLEKEGYDPRCPDVDYPITVWKRCVTQARYLAYPSLSDAEAYRILGRKLAEGFANTLLGRVAVVGLPMIGPARVVERLPRYLSMMGRPELQVQTVSLGERARRVTLSDIYNPPELIAGALEVALEYAHAQPIIGVEDRSPQGFRLLVRW
jgi:uncharacterized protein (TIGR02265 family)